MAYINVTGLSTYGDATLSYKMSSEQNYQTRGIYVIEIADYSSYSINEAMSDLYPIELEV